MGSNTDPREGPGPRQRRRPQVERAAESARSISTYTLIPTMILVGLVGGYFLGAWLEGRFGHAPWLSFGGMVLGGVASIRKIVQLLRVAQAADERKSGSGPRPE